MGPELAPFAWAILFAPLAAAGVAGLLVRRRRGLAAAVAVSGMAVGLLCTLYLLARSLGAGEGEPTGFVHNVDWIRAGAFTARFGVVADRLSLLMALVVTGVGTPIFVYSIGYMHGDEGYGRFFACLSLFAFSMLGIVLSTNLLQTFVFWELVGLSSYLLIGFWFGKDSAVEAGKKAFMVNRVGDFGFLTGIILLCWSAASLPSFAGRNPLDFADLAAFYRAGGYEELAKASPHLLGLPVPALAALLVFCGAVGKSAQFPLHVWLPDAMEGPTPVSALMHAATMVAAGVYMICRVFFLFEPFPEALHAVAWIGGLTAFMAATIALVQTDIKKVLAYSTLSQLGYMVMAVGLAGATAGMFHLTTHAFFKALLFLCSGSVIHACHSQEITEMGGLRKAMPSTFWTWIIGTAALVAVPGTAGFFSKDEILAAAAHGEHASLPLLVVGLVTAGLTAFYMLRCTALTFFGEYRGHGHPHESPAVMTLPLWFLAVPALLVGWLGFPLLFHGHPWFQGEFGITGVKVHEGPHEFHLPLALVGTAFAAAGGILGWMVFGARRIDAAAWKERLLPLHTLLSRKYFLDEFYLWLVRTVQQGIAECSDFFEQNVLIRGVVDGLSAAVKASGRALRELQTGSIHTYVRFALAGSVLVVAWVILSAARGGNG
ncbi:MAG: NADH-quinone oxidoreductase subunit L [Planctomycetaceae bacterium]|nr:NADH-quinone oxidoreductase subunit L [Planctomycetota bacterium]NUN51284.1 NADH-quinone oxidoreductase subunit L [Planctomycetaceae bacterium]